MMLSEKVIAAAKKRDKPGLYRDKYNNLWQVMRVRNHPNSAEWTWSADIVFPYIVDEETA